MSEADDKTQWFFNNYNGLYYRTRSGREYAETWHGEGVWWDSIATSAEVPDPDDKHHFTELTHTKARELGLTQ